MTKRKAYRNMTIALTLIILSIILFVSRISRTYVFWYHVVFYISTGLSVVLSVSSIIYLTKIKKQQHKILEVLDWLSFTMQSLSVILLIFMFFFFSSTVKQSSMYPTLKEGNIVIATQFNYEPERGDIVIIHVDPDKHPTESEKLLVKRIAGIPGDQITFIESPADGGYKILINDDIYQYNGLVYIARYISNEKEIMESSLDDQGYIRSGEYLVFGDNEANSKDSRNLGTFEDEDIIGHVIFRILPFGGLS